MDQEIDEVVDDERAEVHRNALLLYRDHQFWKRETSLSNVRDWTVTELRPWIEASLERGDPPPKAETRALVHKVLRVMEEEDIGGELLLAGGKSYLVEKASLGGMSKADRMRLPRAVALIFAAAQEAEALRGNSSYWDRLEKSSAMGQALCEEYEKAGSSIGARLRWALEPRPLDVLHFSSLCHLEAANDVVEADEYVCKMVDSPSPCLFKVVSVAPRDDPLVVWSNLIYARSDLDQEQQQKDGDDSANIETSADTCTTSSRKQRRKDRHGGKRQARPHWELLASVDFAQHGSAVPGHWHLNTTSCGDVLPHLPISSAAEGGGERETWHGGEDGCPLWWHFIPSGMSHRNTPHRLRALLAEFAPATRDVDE